MGHDAPWFQVVFSSRGRDAWADDAAGLAMRDVAMHVAMPEFDGRITTRAVSFKRDLGRCGLTELIRVASEPEADRVDHVADLAAAWVRLGRSRREARRVAIVLAKAAATLSGVARPTPFAIRASRFG
ncbi:MAG: cobaltochelatase subunit CobN [Pseudomonadota bacterium]